MSRINPWMVIAAGFCAAAWLTFAGAGFKLVDIYANRGPHGFRQALTTHLGCDMDHLRAMLTGVDRVD